MKCIDKVCTDRVLNGGDDVGDFYFCKCVGVEVGRGEEECLIDKWGRTNCSAQDCMHMKLEDNLFIVPVLNKINYTNTKQKVYKY